MGKALKDKVWFLPFAVLVVVGIAWLRWPMLWVMLLGLGLSGGLAWWRVAALFCSHASPGLNVAGLNLSGKAMVLLVPPARLCTIALIP